MFPNVIKAHRSGLSHHQTAHANATGYRNGSIHDSLRANEIQTATERVLSWLDSQWQKVDAWWKGDSLKKAAKKRTITAIKRGHAEAEFKQNFSALIAEAKQNWSEEVKQQ